MSLSDLFERCVKVAGNVGCALFLLGLSPALKAVELEVLDLSVSENHFHFYAIYTGLPDTDSDITFAIFTQIAIIGSIPMERFQVQFEMVNGTISQSPEVTTSAVTPTFDRWLDGNVSDFDLRELGPGSWRFVGSIPHGSQPFVDGDTSGSIHIGVPGGGLTLVSAPIRAAAPALYIIKTSPSRYVSTIGEVIQYEYKVGNGSPYLLHDVAVADDNVDAPPVCTFPGDDVLAPEGEPGDSVICTAQRTVTAEDLLLDFLENTATATSDVTEPEIAELSIPVAVFADGFDSQADPN